MGLRSATLLFYSTTVGKQPEKCDELHSSGVNMINTCYTLICIFKVLSPPFLSARPPLSRAEGRRRSLALPSRRTAARRRRAPKTIHTPSGDHGAFHIVSVFTRSKPHAHTRLPFVTVSMISFYLCS